MGENPNFSNYKAGYVVTFGLLFGFSGLVSWAAYAVSHRQLLGANPYPLVSGTSLALPFVLGESMFFVWAQTHGGLGGVTSAASLTVCACYLLGVALTVLLGNMRFYKRNCIWPLTALLIAVCVTPLTVTDVNEPVSLTKASGGQSGGPPRHVLLIVVDTLRADALSCYGSERVSTPNIDALAEDSCRFGNAVAPSPWTLPSVTSIMTGLSPLAHGATKINSHLPDEFRTLAEYLREAGYDTAAIGTNAMLAEERNLTQGFSEYVWFGLETVTELPTPLSRIGAGLSG